MAGPLEQREAAQRAAASSSDPSPAPPAGPVARTGMLAATRIRMGGAADPTDAGRTEIKGTAGAMRWQRRAYDMYDANEDIKDSYLRFQGLTSRVRWFGAAQVEPDQDPVPVHDAVGEIPGLTPAWADLVVETVQRVRDRETGSQGPIKALSSVNLGLVGDCYLIGREVPADPQAGRSTDEQWTIASVEALRQKSGRWELMESDSPGARGEELNPETTVIGRMWRSHPKFPKKADAPLQAAIQDLEELLLLLQGNHAVAKSRIANSGLLFVSSDLSWSTPVDPKRRSKLATDEDPFMAMLADLMITPIGDPEDAAAVVPGVVRAEGNLESKISHIKFDRPLDETILARIDAISRRVAAALPLPLEAITGIGDTNHWTAWQVDEQTYKVYVQPMVGLQTEGVTAAWVRPALREAGMPEILVARMTTGSDPSAIVTHPNREKSWADAHKDFVISDDARRRAIGATDDDAPDDAEVARRIEIERAKSGKADTSSGASSNDAPNSGTPPSDNSARRVELLERITAAAGPSEERQAIPQASLNHLARRLTTIDRALLERVHVAADRAVTAAVKRAGSKLRSRAQGDATTRAMVRDVPAERVGTVLGRAHAERLAQGDELIGEDDLQEFSDDYDRWTKRAQAAALAAVRRNPGSTLTDDQAAEISDQQDDDRTAGRGLLIGAMLALAVDLLFNNDRDVPVVGEASDLAVPTADVRASLTRAGGTTLVEAAPTAGGSALLEGGQPAGMVATGTRMSLTMQVALRAHASAWEWLWGGADNPFPPHLELDGVGFDSWTDPVLTNDDTFPDTPFLYPGDHDGCSCIALPTLTVED